MTTVGKILGLFLAITSGLLWAYVALCYWGWFVVPLGLPEISYVHMWGLLLFGYLFRLYIKIDTKEQVFDEEIFKIVAVCVTALVFLLLGYFLSYYM